MKPILDYRSKRVVDVYDEVNLWSAPFALWMLQHIPMYRTGTIVDLGFGTGFPVVELRQRFGSTVKLIGVDIWQEGIDRTKEKIEVLSLDNIEIRTQRAEDMSFEDQSVDMFCSNLGVNNFESRTRVFEKVWRFLKPSGDLVFTTNDERTFGALFEIFRIVFEDLELNIRPLDIYIKARGNQVDIQTELEANGYELVKFEESEFSYRFSSAEALFDHSIIRIAFKEEWEKLVGEKYFDVFFKRVSELISNIIDREGEIRLSVPVLYFHFKKRLSRSQMTT